MAEHAGLLLVGGMATIALSLSVILYELVWSSHKSRKR